jgi:hypothetical protein
MDPRGVGVGVAVGVVVRVGVAVDVGVDVGVAVDVGVRVGVAVGAPGVTPSPGLEFWLMMGKNKLNAPLLPPMTGWAETSALKIKANTAITGNSLRAVFTELLWNKIEAFTPRLAPILHF